MSHAELLAALLPLGSYDPNGPRLTAELGAEGAALDAAQDSASVLFSAAPWLNGDATLLPDWERLYAITPPAGTTIAQRQAVVLSRIRATGGLSIPYFRELIQVAGFEVVIDEPREFRVGHRAGDRLYKAEQVKWYWRVRIRRNGNVLTAEERTQVWAWLEDLKPAWSTFDIED